MSFTVLKAGFLATIQDAGRFGYGSYGINICGAADEHSYHWGNHLLDNDSSAASIEITFGNFCLCANINTFIATTGGDLDFKINDKSAPTWQVIKVYKNDVLSWGLAKNGIRAYLAITGGLQTQSWFGSHSVNLRENIGTKLKQQDVLQCVNDLICQQKFTPLNYIPNYHKPVILRILPSYQFREFSTSQRATFLENTWTISNLSDRTGCRLDGIALNFSKQNMISEGISYGSVEITTAGLPIILLKDTPTIGGYPKIGTVFSLDLCKLSQQQAGAKVKFKLITIAQAQQKRLEFDNFFRKSLLNHHK